MPNADQSLVRGEARDSNNDIGKVLLQCSPHQTDTTAANKIKESESQTDI